MWKENENHENDDKYVCKVYSNDDVEMQLIADEKQKQIHSKDHSKLIFYARTMEIIPIRIFDFINFAGENCATFAHLRRRSNMKLPKSHFQRQKNH